jgi:Na+/melibiose symporter-like transporter
MVFVVGVVLEYVGYVSDGPQSDAVKTWILLLTGAMPLTGYVIGALAFSRFELTESLHARIRAELDARATSP